MLKPQLGHDPSGPLIEVISEYSLSQEQVSLYYDYHTTCHAIV